MDRTDEKLAEFLGIQRIRHIPDLNAPICWQSPELLAHDQQVSPEVLGIDRGDFDIVGSVECDRTG